MFLQLRKHCIYLPKQVSFFDPQSTMYFLAEELHDEAKYVFFCPRSAAVERGYKFCILVINISWSAETREVFGRPIETSGSYR